MKTLKNLLFFAFLPILLTSCASANKAKGGEVLTVASHTAPMTTMLEMIQDDLKKENITLKILRVSDNVQANVAVKNREADANFFQHRLFMEIFNEKNHANLAVVSPIYDARVAYFSRKYSSFDALPDGARVAIPSDSTNLTRALRLLQSHGYLKLKDENSFRLHLGDIKENPKKLTFVPVSLLNLNEAYKECDAAFDYPAYSEKIGLLPMRDGILLEDGAAGDFAICLVAREDNKETRAIQLLKKALTSDKIRHYIEGELKDHAKVAFP